MNLSSHDCTQSILKTIAANLGHIDWSKSKPRKFKINFHKPHP